ncbi:ATP-binding protein [soil metagenome]|jgi:predicted HTH transcriptional regulator
MNELQALISQGESDTLEFKQRIKHPDRIARTIVSLANTRGGIILVGVMDNGEIKGVDPEEEKHTLDLASQFFCDPPVRLFYKEVEEEDLTILKVIVPESGTKPHYAKVKEDDWRAYVRVKDESVQTSKVVEKALQQEPPQPPKRTLDRNELLLLTFLKENPRITQGQYMKLANLSRRRAARYLIALSLEGIIRLHDKEKENYYTLS